ncbi:MAG: hypothetical protein ACKVG0_04775, partial [Alphaproteobacteria bacterium]
SRIILAYLPARTVTKLYEAAPQSFAEGELGGSFADVKIALKQIRVRGWMSRPVMLRRGSQGLPRLCSIIVAASWAVSVLA